MSASEPSTHSDGSREFSTRIDDLIENNRRRIALLEQMAQAIYREWFVHFRYPGHEDDELVDSPLGPIPAGWDVVDVSRELVEATVAGSNAAVGETAELVEVRADRRNRRLEATDVMRATPSLDGELDIASRSTFDDGDVLVSSVRRTRRYRESGVAPSTMRQVDCMVLVRLPAVTHDAGVSRARERDRPSLPLAQPVAATHASTSSEACASTSFSMLSLRQPSDRAEFVDVVAPDLRRAVERSVGRRAVARRHA